MFDAKIKQKDDNLTINLSGDLDIYSEKEFKKFVEEKLKPTNTDIVFDFSELSYIDSTGLGMFINIYKDQIEKNKTIKIINAKDNIKKLFKITDLTELFEME